MSQKARLIFLLAAIIVTLPGCFDVSDEIWWRANGSVHFRRTLHLVFTAETAEAKAKAISEAGDFEAIDLLRSPQWHPLVRTLDIKATNEGPNVTVVEDLELEPGAAPILSSVQAEIANHVKVDGKTFPWCPSFAFDKFPNGNTKFSASLLETKPPVDFDRDGAKALFGDRVYSLKVYGPSIATAAPASVQIANNSVEWRIPMSDIALEQARDELLAEIGPPFPTVGASVLGAIALVLVAAIVLILRASKKAEQRALRPPAPRTMPSVMESGPVPQVASDEAFLSDASEINIETDEEIAPAPVVTAQAAADGVVKFKCPKCQVELKVPLHLAGRQGKCRKCGGGFVSPVPAQLKQVRAAVAATPSVEPSSLRDAFSVKKVRCSCGVTSAVLKGRADGEERCPACNQVLVVA